MPKQKRRRKSSGPGSRIVWISAFALVALSLFLGWEVLFPFGPQTETFVDIPAHTGTLGVARALARGGVVRDAWTFAALREVEGGSLKAGEYRFDHPASALQVYRRLRMGDVFTIQVTIPEGDNIFDIAEAVQGAGLASSTAFLAAAKADVGLVRNLDPHAQTLEGYLFPDTYRFSRHATPAIILGAMTRRFGQIALRLGLAGSELPRTVTMASLIEREVRVDAERPLVAGVFENRLRRGMPLQTDPAVVYASLLQGTWTGVIHQSELRSASLYNTYTHTGLPPGPICNPGVAALRAALHPAQTDYLYFVANVDGSTRFARQLSEHNANVVAYRGALHSPK